MAKNVTSTGQDGVQLGDEIVRSFRFTDPTTLLCCALCTLTFAYWSYSLVGSLTFPGLAFLALLPPTLFLLGRGLLGLIRFETPSHPFAIAFLVGALAASIMLFFLNLFSPLPLRDNCIAVLVAAVLLRRFSPRVDGPPVERSSKFYTTLAVFLALAAATFWTQELRPYLVGDGGDVRLRPWIDFFVHADLVGQYCSDRSIWSMGDPDLFGERLPFYHYASYLLPACVSAWTGQSANDTIATFWIPFGFLLAGLAAYTLAGVLWGNPAGLAALIGVLLVSDSSTYGVRCGWYSFHWLVAVGAGLLYGIAGGAVVVLLIVKGIRPTNWTVISLGVVLAFLNILLKAHIFVVGFPALVAWLVLFKEGWSTGRRLVVGLAIAVMAGAAILVADRLKIGPLFILFHRYHGIGEYVRAVAGKVPADSWEGTVLPLRDERPIYRHPFLVLLLVIGGPFGALALAYPILMLVSKILKKLQPEDAIPALTLAVYFYLVFLTPSNTRGAPDELWHRPFVWVYFLLAVWVWGKSFYLLTTSRFGTPRVLPAVMAVAGLALLVKPLERGKVIQSVGTRAGSGYTNVPIRSDFLGCARFLRDHAGKLDVVQNDPYDKDLNFVLPVPVLASFSERRCYLGRPLHYWTMFATNPSGRAESVRRQRILEDLRNSDSMDRLFELADRTGIRWYLANPSEALKWPAEFLDHPAYVSGQYRVYDLAVKRR